MSDHNLHERFLEVVGQAKVDLAAADPDLVGYYELKIHGFTDEVSSDRAELLEDYDQEQLWSEIRKDYYLSKPEFQQVLSHCLAKIVNAYPEEDSKH